MSLTSHKHTAMSHHVTWLRVITLWSQDWQTRPVAARLLEPERKAEHNLWSLRFSEESAAKQRPSWTLATKKSQSIHNLGPEPQKFKRPQINKILNRKWRRRQTRREIKEQKPSRVDQTAGSLDDDTPDGISRDLTGAKRHTSVHA